MFSACEEVPPAIDFSEPVVPSKDSTYTVSTEPPAQHKAVLIEDITGVRCINCPDAALKAKDKINKKSECKNSGFLFMLRSLDKFPLGQVLHARFVIPSL